jgi:hypothetical protein
VARALALSLAALGLAADARAHEGTLLASLEAQLAAREALARPRAREALVPLRITLRDAESGAEVAGNVRITRADGSPLALDLAEPRPQEPRPQGFHACAGSFQLLVPREKLRVEAFQGLETALATREVDLSGGGGAQLDIPLVRFVRAGARGLASGNTHLHLMAWDRARVETYLRDATAADQIDFAWVSHLLRFDSDTPYTTNELSRADLEALSTPSTRFGFGAELRHNFGEYSIGYGHVLLLGLVRPLDAVSIGPVLAGTPEDAPGLVGAIAEAKGQGASAIWAHGSNGYEDLPSWLLGRLDAQNLYDGAAPDEVLKGDHATYARVFYPLLDVGLHVPFSTGTDWFIGDLARVYVPLPGERTTAAFLAQLRAGHSFITNGPLLDFAVGEAGPGGVVALAAPGPVPVRASAIGRANFGALEVIAGGRVVARAEARAVGDHYEAEIAEDVALAEPTWLAARAAPGEATSEFGKPLFAHSSAVTVVIAGERPFRSDVARALVLEMDWNARAIREKAKFASAAQADEVTAPYGEAIDALAPRMGWRDRAVAWAVRVLRTLKAWLGL